MISYWIFQRFTIRLSKKIISSVQTLVMHYLNYLLVRQEVIFLLLYYRIQLYLKKLIHNHRIQRALVKKSLISILILFKLR